MPILKFWKENNNQTTLDTLRMEDITNDKRTKLLNRTSFMQEKYKIDNQVYMIINDTFFKFANLFNKNKTPISAMIISEGKNDIIIVPSKNYVFWNGKSVEPESYNFLFTESDIMKMIT